MKILMVCLGNICRSPLAEGIMKTKLPKDFFVDSAGTIALHQGEKPDHRSIAVAEKYNIDISTQKSRKITTEDLDLFDYIFCMDSQNLSDVKAMAKNEIQRSKIYMLMPDGSNVPDPYYGGVEGFENVFTMVDKACTERVIRLLKKQ